MTDIEALLAANPSLGPRERLVAHLTWLLELDAYLGDQAIPDETP